MNHAVHTIHNGYVKSVSKGRSMGTPAPTANSVKVALQIHQDQLERLNGGKMSNEILWGEDNSFSSHRSTELIGELSNMSRNLTDGKPL